ncbi:MAG: hypothetical protein WC400_02270, partial [Patescibacteria group bacterium]
MIKIVVHKKSRAVRIMALILNKEFKKLGLNSRVIVCDDLERVSRWSKDVYFVFTPHKFVDFRRSSDNRNAKFILYQQEQLSEANAFGVDRINQLRSFIDQYDHIVEASQMNVPVYKKLMRSVDFILPTAYHDDLEFRNMRGRNPKYDCLFFGRYSDK